MTNRAKHDTTPQPELGFLANHKALLAIRVRPAEFARLLGVSKQTVSTWIRDGKVTINTLDGLLDVRRAIQDVLRNTSPGRLRSRVLRQAVTDALELRENLARAEDRAEIAEAALRAAQGEIAHLARWNADGDAHAETFRALLIERAETLRATPTEAWEQTLSDLSDAAWDVVDPEDAADALDAARSSRNQGGAG
jgi:transcriptional regulator with XRE-family HTH domain